MVQWVVGSILRGGPIELFLVPERDVVLWQEHSLMVVRSILHGGPTELFVIPERDVAP